ncbi:MAG: sugar phosphate isomerase/epimerase family protein [Pirellulales bacterium]
MPRRRLLVAAVLAAPAVGAAEALAPPITLGIGTYGMQSLAPAAAVDLVADTGFDSIEVAALADGPMAPERLTAVDRHDLRARLAGRGLVLSALMENLPPAADETVHRGQLERLARAAALSRDLAPDRVPLVQTILGGGRWDDVRGLFAERLAAWRDLAAREAFRIAIKPHRSGALSTPEDGLWLLAQLGDHASLGLVFDASHLVFRGIDPAATLVTAAPRVFHVAVKDAVERGGTVGFELPGATGTPDHAAILRGLVAAGYRGDVCCEVSGQVSKRPGYDPAAAARDCHRAMRGAFAAAGVSAAAGIAPGD